MTTLPEEEQKNTTLISSPDKSCEEQKFVISISPQEQEELLAELRHEALEARTASLRNPSPPPIKVSQGLDNLSSLLSNLEESWTMVKPQLVKQEDEPMKEEDLVIPEPPSLAHLRLPKAPDQFEQSPTTLTAKDNETSTALPVEASAEPSAMWTSHRIGRRPRQSSPKEEPPRKSRLMTALRQLPSRLTRMLPSSPMVFGEKIVRDLAIQESTVNSFTLNGQEYKLSKTIAPASLKKSTSLTIHDLLNTKNSPEYRSIKEQMYRSFRNEPLRPYKPGSFLRWDRLMQIDLITAQELRQQLSGNGLDKFPYEIEPSCSK
jgi:hypothetical protein